MSIGQLGTNLSGILIIIRKFSFTKMRLKISSVKWRPFCPGGGEIIINMYVWISPLSPFCVARSRWVHYCGVIMVANASQITRLTIVYSAVYSDAHQRKQQSSASPVPGEFPAQMASYAEKVSIWGRHHVNENKLFGYGIYVLLIRVWCMSQIGLNVLCYSCHVYFSDFVSWIEDNIF